jgi:glutathione synthase/RimK-type ligase-like ATP-grasp enzyme
MNKLIYLLFNFLIKFLIKFLILLILLISIFYIFNKLLINYFSEKEHMTMENSRLQEVLINGGYEVDTEKYIIKKCVNDKCFEKKYDSINFNNMNSHKLAKNKILSNTIFMENNIPVPNHIIINNENKYKINLIFPCVLKPIDGMQGKDVNTFIKNRKQFYEILNKLLEKYDNVMMENQVYGDNYRIFIFNNKVMDIIKREQPYIIGDNKKTVDQLINDKNKEQIDKNLFPTKYIDEEYIKEQGYLMNDVLPLKRKVFITNTINFHNGANPVRIDIEKVPNENLNMFVKAHKLIGLECSGVDYMSDNIYVPYLENDGHIIEINDMVDTKIHIDADYGKDPYFLFNNIYENMV